AATARPPDAPLAVHDASDPTEGEKGPRGRIRFGWLWRCRYAREKMSIALHLHERGARGSAPASLPTQPAPILLLSLPFGLPSMPSLGLSLLKAGLAVRGIAADVQYLGLRFAHIFGYPLYQRLAHGGGSFLGDWIFYPALYGPPSEAHRERFWQLAFAD